MRRLWLLAPFALAGCVAGPDYERPDFPATMSGEFLESADPSFTTEPLPERWWRLYDDPVLDTLIEDAFAANTDLRAALANIAEARAILSEERNARLPTTETSASYTRTRVAAGGAAAGQAGGGQPAGQAFEFQTYDATLSADYEVDLFGRITSAINAAEADLDALVAARDLVRVTIAADVTLSLERHASALKRLMRAAMETPQTAH